MSDLREGGDIENDADVIIFLHKSENDLDVRSSLIIGKHRNGPVGEIEINFLEKKMQFVDLYKGAQNDRR
ncbi:MAG: replicative DNA helicase, partial [Chloroflexi bacterium]|nr:replicative DNA helicase [Chloroflexota bacterium]